MIARTVQSDTAQPCGQCAFAPEGGKGAPRLEDRLLRDIGGILHTLNTAFENLHDMLLSDVAMDVSSEIAALQGMLAQDGLTQNEPLR